jgi:hypothetical protein
MSFYEWLTGEKPEPVEEREKAEDETRRRERLVRSDPTGQEEKAIAPLPALVIGKVLENEPSTGSDDAQASSASHSGKASATHPEAPSPVSARPLLNATIRVTAFDASRPAIAATMSSEGHRCLMTSTTAPAARYHKPLAWSNEDWRNVDDDWCL